MAIRGGEVVFESDEESKPGRPWLYDRSIIHNGRTNAYSLVMDGKPYVLAPLSPKEVCELKRVVKDRMEAYEKEKQKCESAHEKEKVPKQQGSCVENNKGQEQRVEFEDVFPEELPSGLSPLKGIEHQIDLVPRSSIPNRPAYRVNPEETKELQCQVEELLSKGYVKESLSPCDVPVLSSGIRA
ncbi:uncharacterized protein LOC125369574 [Ricinus communis]|uniref:uncharacterized protein LOC125369574 n=1 Tax=Ricinus communis TaxID=3988 RepID=UPI00201B10EB|nr:uncharacterized protein LOC125369574 [Ricinus communis]